MDLTIIGPGRAGIAVATAAANAGHRIVAVVGRNLSSAEAAAAELGATPFGVDAEFPPAELLVIATGDDVIAAIAGSVAGRIDPGPESGAVHLSGLVGRDALSQLEVAGYQTGVFHPLQTLPTPQAGAARLPGAWVGITATDLRDRLVELAESMGMHPFDIADDNKALYHAAAAAAANFPLASLSMSRDLFAAAGVPFESAQPLVEAIVANAFALGPRAALTGPVARGDVGTVSLQMDAVARAEPTWLADFVASVQTLARISGNGPEFDEMLESWERPREVDQ